MTVAMAFDYFSQEKVDYALIEVGLGGQFDSTNIITPILSVITNISLDHQDILGDTLAKIASEKAGIIKEKIPVVIGEYHEETFPVFQEKAKKEKALLLPAFEEALSKDDFLPTYQLLNYRTVQKAANYLKEQNIVQEEAIEKGFKNYLKNTNLKGRWQQLGEQPSIFCDTAHNEAGIQLIVEQLNKCTFDNLYIVIGVVNDKDITKILKLFPKKAYYYYCQAKLPRALPAIELAQKAKNIGLKGEVILDVNEAINKAKQQAKTTDFIYIGGSNFVVAEINEL
jgi:dihydrofolate synthase / folylpolyglutamate synthase